MHLSWFWQGRRLGPRPGFGLAWAEAGLVLGYVGWARPGLGLGLGSLPVFGFANIFCTVLEDLAEENSHKGVELWLDLLGVESASRFWVIVRNHTSVYASSQFYKIRPYHFLL